MTSCVEVLARLPGLLYGDLPADEAEAVRKHLVGCPACRREHTTLEGVRRLLDTASAPPAVEVDLGRLYGEAAGRRRRRARRWRRAAALVGIAAAVLLLIGLKLEVRLEAHQLVLRWGVPPMAEQAVRQTQPPTPLVRQEGEPAPVAQAELQLVRDLVHALADDVEGRDRENRQALLWVRGRLDQLQRQVQARWEATEQLVSALHTVQCETRAKGEKE
jgi:hypothetical protein